MKRFQTAARHFSLFKYKNIQHCIGIYELYRKSMKNYTFIINNSSNSDAIMAELIKAEDSFILNSTNRYTI